MEEAIDVKNHVRQFIFKKFPLARKQQVKDSDALVESGLLDSQGLFEVVMFIESKFAINVADEDLDPKYFHTIDCITEYIERKKMRNSALKNAFYARPLPGQTAKDGVFVVYVTP